MSELAEGHKAPGFKMPTDGGGEVSLESLSGKPFLLYFYPKDDTPGCTVEANDFRTRIDEFNKLGVKIIGVSKDSVESHDKFKGKHCLPFLLGSDEHSNVSETYGVWVKKNMYGKEYMGIERATFLVDGKGIIRKIWRKVKADGHAEEVLKAARAALQ